MSSLETSSAPDSADQQALFFDIAASIADQLVRDAVWDNDRCTWLGYEMDLVDGEWRSVYKTIDESVYGGLAGVALFLGAIWAVSGNSEYAKAASGAAKEAIRLVRERRSISLHGWYSGVVGTLSTIRSVTRILPDAQTIEDADLLREVLAVPFPDDGSFDLIAGPSGTLAGLLTLPETATDPTLRAACHANAEWLLRQAQTGPGTGVSWREHNAEGTSAFPPCGLAHGASSAAHALLEYWAATNDDRYKQAGFQAFEYERQWFDRGHCGWPDLRDVGATQAADPGAMTYPTFWCYGVGGIALSRLRAWQLTKDKTVLAEANAAIFACKQYARQVLDSDKNSAGFEENASLCHGLGSIVEPLLYSAQLRYDPEALDLARRLGLAMATPSDEEWPCGVVGGGETPGLMLGLAGIGQMYLGLSAPAGMQVSGLVLSTSDPTA